MSWDLDGLLGQNVAACLGSSGFHHKTSKASQIDVFATFKVATYSTHERLYGDLNVSFFHSGLVRNLAYNVRLGHGLCVLGWFVVQYQRLVKAFSGLQKYTHTFENEMNDKGFLGQNDIGVRAAEARRSMKAWYSRHARALPWRENPSVYGTWLSEIMLQQTRVDTGIPKWHAFQEAFPDVAALAGASEEEVLKAWEGLGYYRRARLLHRAAQVIQQSGRFPSTYAGWLSLPGIGPYSAAAIASIAFGEADVQPILGDSALTPYGGRAGWGLVPGAGVSSTRAELAALVIAAAAHGSHHVALGSGVVVTTFKRWREGRLDLGRKPWAMRANGDLWELLGAMLRANGGE